MPLSRFARIAGSAVAALVLIAEGRGIVKAMAGPRSLEVTAVALDIARPDALVVSDHLSRLPADVLRVPLLKQVLTDDFADYYEDNPTRLSILGTLRRIAYEHELTIGDTVVKSVLDEPATVALWRGPGGRLDHWAMLLRTNALAMALEHLGRIASSDRQLYKVAQLDESRTPVYALELGGHRTLLLATSGSNLLVLSDPGVLFQGGDADAARPPASDETGTAARPEGAAAEDDAAGNGSETAADSASGNGPADASANAPGNAPGSTAATGTGNRAAPPAARAHRARKPAGDTAAPASDVALAKPVPTRALLVEKLLTLSAGEPSVWSARFALAATPQGHHVALAGALLSFDYQSFFPALDALRFDFDGRQWSSGVRLDPARFSRGEWAAGALWANLPATPAACASVPLDPERVAAMAASLDGEKLDRSALASTLAGPATVCWYAGSRLSSPLLVARLADRDAARRQSALLGRIFARVVGATEPKRKGRFPVQARTPEDGPHVWSRIVSARYGSREASRAPKPAEIGAGRYFPVTLALTGETLLFSPDGDLVRRALEVDAKRAPAAAEQLADAARTVITITPARLSNLLEKETFDTLSADDEPLLRTAARTHLVPRLTALAKSTRIDGRLDGPLPNDGPGWVPLEWVEARR